MAEDQVLKGSGLVLFAMCFVDQVGKQILHSSKLRMTMGRSSLNQFPKFKHAEP